MYNILQPILMQVNDQLLSWWCAINIAAASRARVTFVMFVADDASLPWISFIVVCCGCVSSSEDGCSVCNILFTCVCVCLCVCVYMDVLESCVSFFLITSMSACCTSVDDVRRMVMQRWTFNECSQYSLCSACWCSDVRACIHVRCAFVLVHVSRCFSFFVFLFLCVFLRNICYRVYVLFYSV